MAYRKPFKVSIFQIHEKKFYCIQVTLKVKKKKSRESGTEAIM